MAPASATISLGEMLSLFLLEERFPHESPDDEGEESKFIVDYYHPPPETVSPVAECFGYPALLIAAIVETQP